MDKRLKTGIIIAVITGPLSVTLAFLLPFWVSRCDPNPHDTVTHSVTDTVTPKDTAPPPLTIISGHSWGTGLTVASEENAVIFNGTVDSAGFYFYTSLGATLRNKTLIMDIKNSQRSTFSNNNAMFKLSINQTDLVLHPLHISPLALSEYVPFGYQRVEFLVPPDFDGRVAFTFTRASLNNFEISLSYRD